MASYSRITNNPNTLSKPLGLYSQVCEVKSSNLIFLAGQVSVDKEGNLVGENDIALQVTQIYQNIADAKNPSVQYTSRKTQLNHPHHKPNQFLYL